MATKTKEKFRPTLFVQDIHQVVDQDPAFEYKNVIMNYRHENNRVQRYLDAGWEIVLTTVPSKDDRAFTPNSKDEKLRPQEYLTTTRDGQKQILMRCLRSVRAENEKAKKQYNDDMALAMDKRRGANSVRKGNNIVTTEAEINENNV